MSKASIGFQARSKAADQEQEATKCLKKAKKLLGPSLLEWRFKPDWEQAGPFLERAAVMFKQCGNHAKAIEALERAATSQEKQGSPYHAAKHFETCADLSNQLKQYEDTVRFVKMAANMYVECGKSISATEALTKGARSLEEHSPEQAEALYYDALDIFETEAKDAQAADTFRFLIAHLIRAEKWADAVEAQMRFGMSCDRAEARHSQLKAYVGAVITWLYAGDAKSAWQTYQDAMEIEFFANASEAYAVDELFMAYGNEDADAIKQVIQKKPCFKQLDHVLARIAVKLPQGKLKRMARHIRKLMGPAEDEDEDYDGNNAGGGQENGEEVL